MARRQQPWSFTSRKIFWLGALVAAHIFDTAIPVFSLNQTDYQALTHAGSARLAGCIVADEVQISIDPLPLDQLVLTDQDLQIRNGAEGRAMAMAMDIICGLRPFRVRTACVM